MKSTRYTNILLDQIVTSQEETLSLFYIRSYFENIFSILGYRETVGSFSCFDLFGDINRLPDN